MSDALADSATQVVELREQNERLWSFIHGACSAIENLPIKDAEDWLRNEWWREVESYRSVLSAAGTSVALADNAPGKAE